MATKPINPWNLDEYARFLHHSIGYLMAKSKLAAEKDDVEAVERYAGKVAYLFDKVVALVKVRALATEVKMNGISDPEPDLFDDPRLPQDFKAKVTKDFMKRGSQLAEKRALAKVWDLEEDIVGLNERRGRSAERQVFFP